MKNPPLHSRLDFANIFWVVLLTFLVDGCCTCPDSRLKQLPTFQDISYKHEYKPARYIREAIELQAMGADQAYRHMLAVAILDDHADQIFVLCRMLYTERKDSEFQRPELGGAVFLGGTPYSAWPLEPICLVDGVPFIIVWGYTCFGSPQLPAEYLYYCHEHCDWNRFQYKEKSHAELAAALQTLLKSSKWQRPLEVQELDILKKQIE